MKHPKLLRCMVWLPCLALVSMPATGHADTDTNWTQKVDIGGIFGPNLASIHGPGTSEEGVSYSYNIGMSIGGIVGARLTEIIAAQAEIAFTTKGPQFTVNGMGSRTLHLNYLELPLLARVALPVPGRIGYHATLGPVFGILLGANADLADGTNVDRKDRLENLDIGLMIGTGAAMQMGKKGAITLDVRYSRGLLNLERAAVREEDEVMNHAFYFLVGYRTNLDDLLQRFRRQAPPTNTQPTPALTSPPGEAPAP